MMHQRTLASLSLVLAALGPACGGGSAATSSNPLPVGGEGSGAGGAGGATGGGGAGATGGVGNGGAGGVGNGGAGNSGNVGNTGGQGACGTSSATITSVGNGSATLLQGTVVTPATSFVGEVLVVGDTIACAAASCSSEPGAAGATVIDTQGFIYPGLIDAHNHVLFNIFDESDWSPAQSYTNHEQWKNEDRYGAVVDAKQHLNGEAYTGASCVCGDGACKSGGGCGEDETTCPSDCVSFGCEMLKYGELKALISGTTSALAAAGGAQKPCFNGLVRTIDMSVNGLPDDKVQTATPFPAACTAKSVCDNFDEDSTDSYVIHIAEGTDLNARDEFDDLGTVTSGTQTCSGMMTQPDPNCLYAPQTAIVHGTALDAPRFDIMAQNGMHLVWSPRSNVFLYGGGSDLSKTTNIPYALSVGINVALAPDWSLGGSVNLLEEVAYAQIVDGQAGWGVLTPKRLLEMVTINAAKALAVDAYVGTIEVGKKADLMVITSELADPYEAFAAARPEDVILTMVGGVVLHGDPQLVAAAPAAPGCETIDVCCRTKFVCVATTDTDDLHDQTLADITQILNGALGAYDALDVTEWNFAPIAPLVRCQ